MKFVGAFMKTRIHTILVLCTVGISAAIANSAQEIPIKHTMRVQLQSQVVINLLSQNEINADQSLNYLESYVNPYSLLITDTELNQYTTFAANSPSLKWDIGYAVQLTDGTVYLCQTEVFVKGECIKVFNFIKHGLSESPVS